MDGRSFSGIAWVLGLRTLSRRRSGFKVGRWMLKMDVWMVKRRRCADKEASCIRRHEEKKEGEMVWIRKRDRSMERICIEVQMVEEES